ncbi:MAG TPA: NADP-dependent oxidoreductase [Alphaproteobacteria bacterium]|nr:NADP-dependent oxidoreductase [Alphaproteobacteria bacterium]
MPAKINRQMVIAGIPVDRLQTSHYTMREAEAPEPAAGQVLVRTLLISMDPVSRTRITGKPGGLQIGDVMPSSGLGQVAASNHPDYTEGQIVECQTGWQDYSVHGAEALTGFTRLGPLTHHLSVYGVSGLTGYFGMAEAGAPKPGETVLVSAAGGAVGHIAGQVAKIRGARVVGIVGSKEKSEWLTGTLGYDAAIDRRAGPLGAAIKQACPDGVDLYFDNVGGEILETTLTRMKDHGRIVICGYASQYDTQTPETATRGVPSVVLYKRLRIDGYVVMDYYDQKQAAREQLAQWLKAGKLHLSIDLLDGLERAPEGFVGLFNGENRGKRMIRVAEEI